MQRQPTANTFDNYYNRPPGPPPPIGPPASAYISTGAPIIDPFASPYAAPPTPYMPPSYAAPPSYAPPPFAPAPSYGYMPSGAPGYPVGYGSYAAPPTPFVNTQPMQPQAPLVIPQLKVMVMQGRNLAKKDFFGLMASDPYCKVEYNHQFYQTRRCHSTKSPVWYDEFEFRNVQRNDKIYITVMDSDMIKKDDFMGQVVLGWDDFSVQKESWFTLRPRSGTHDRVAGEIQIGFKPYYY